MVISKNINYINQDDPNRNINNNRSQQSSSQYPQQLQNSSLSSNTNNTIRKDKSKKEIQSRKPCIVLMGLRKSGKSSIQNVVFHRLSPGETLFLESTNKINQNVFSSFMDFQIWDFPGELDFFDPSFDAEAIFTRTDALIFVIDAQDEYLEALQRLFMVITRAYKYNPSIYFEVFIHKVDGLSDFHKIEIQRDIHQSIMDELIDSQLDNVHVSFYSTSIYDHSVYEALSKVIQKLITQLPTLENLLNILCSNSGIEKAFLFDTSSKIYIATDSSPVDMQSYEICSDMIDVVMDMSSIYSQDSELKTNNSNSVVEAYGHTVIKLANNTVLFMRNVTNSLALVCLVRKDNFENQGILEYNFKCFQSALLRAL